MNVYTASFPFIEDMGKVPMCKSVADKPTETKEEEALWHLNKMREHDGLERLEELPKGCEFKLQ